MTTEEFLSRHPNAKENENCLEDIACPDCGSRERFLIDVLTTCTVMDDGTERFSDCEWDDESPCVCSSCCKSGSVSDFTIDGLDAEIHEQVAIASAP